MRRALFLALSLGLFAALPAWSKAPEILKFTESQAQTTVEIVDKLATRHYRNQPFNDELSSRFLDQYLENLDPSKSYFLASDIKEFEKIRFDLDNHLQAGKLQKGFEIFHRYRERVSARLESLIAELESDKFDFTFEANESLEMDREGAEWPANQKAADEIWRKRLKSAALGLKLAGKNREETVDTLTRRYSNQLKRIMQQDGADAFEAMINSLTLLYDPHSNYFSPRSLENFNINMSLSLEGIGAVLQTEDEFTKVVSLVAAGPADKQGELRPADKIIAVGQGDEGEMVDVIGWRLDEVVQLIRGPRNTVVRLEVIPAAASSNANTKVIRISRDKVKLEEQAAKKAVFELTDGQDIYKVGVIDIPAFYIDFDAYRNRDPNFKSTTRDVRRLLNELAEEHVDGIVLDLRNNGGGSLQEATTLTDLFIDQGPVVQIRQTNQTISRHHRSRTKAKYRGPLVVLINRLSASAAEIFAGAIQDYNRGLVIGARSFGKGTVQSLTPVHEGQLKITESKFYRVSGDSTQHRGVIPDITFPTLVDAEEVGESSYENALPWDQIHAVPHPEYFNLSAVLPELIKAHKDRSEKDPDFVYLLDQLALMEKSQDRKTISLNEKIRKQEQDVLEQEALAIENKRRKAKGLKPYASVAEYKKENGDDDSEAASASVASRAIKPDKDPLLMESGYILVDFVRSLKKTQPQQVANF